jgi:hypothetical protein
MSMFRRMRSAARILLRGDSRNLRRNPIPAITSAEVAEIKRFFPRDKFFIFGYARSGTTLLMRLARLHPEVHCNYQAHFFTRKPLLKSLVDNPEVEEWLNRRSNRWNLGRDLSAVVLRAAADFIMEREAEREGKRIVGDKSPSSMIHGQSVRDLHSLFPDAKLVYIVRDGRDVVVSERFRNLVEESRYLRAEDKRILEQLRRNPESFGDSGRSIFTEAMVRRVAEGWSADVREIQAEGRRLFGRHFLVIRYEDLLENAFAELSRLWKFLGVGRVGRPLSGAIAAEMKSNPDEEWQSRRSAELAPFLRKGSPGNWRNLFTTREKRIFKAVAGEALIAWKYEAGMDW